MHGQHGAIGVTTLAALTACCAPSDRRVGDATRAEKGLLTWVAVEPSLVGPLVLERVDGSFEPLAVPARGGMFELPRGAWLLRAAKATRNVPSVPVPAFSNARLTVRIARVPAGDEEFLTIPAGPALIGDRLGVGQPDERPLRIVDVPAFQIGRCEVTNAQFVEFLNRAEGPPALDRWIDLRSRKCRISRGAEGAYETDAPKLPVVTVSFEGAQAYCASRTKHSSDGALHQYRLPTEIEWEKAARGPRSSVFSYGDIYTPSAANQESGRLKSVRSFAPSPWGLYDMTGNAFEWTSDIEDATGEDAQARVYLRGGSFVLDGIFLRNAFRMLLRPNVRADDVGFRIVRELR